MGGSAPPAAEPTAVEPTPEAAAVVEAAEVVAVEPEGAVAVPAEADAERDARAPAAPAAEFTKAD